MELIKLSRPYLKDKNNLMNLIEEIIDSGLFVQGKYVSLLENQVANYLDVKHAIAVSSGTAALHLSLVALGISNRDEVIVPAYTFPATANVVELVGAKPVLIDVDLETYNMAVDQLENSITHKTKAIIPVHLFGNPANMAKIMEIAKKYNLWVIEDAAGALGAVFEGKKCGTIGHLGCFSFHPRKIVTTAEGGIIVTNDDELANKIRILRNHGILENGNQKDFVLAGFNYRMNEIEAALGIIQMKEIKKIIEERQVLSKTYIDYLSDVSNIQFQKILPNCTSVWQAFVMYLKNKNINRLQKLLQDNMIEVNIGTYAVHILQYYAKKYGYKEDDYPNAFELYSRSIALPFYNGMEIEKVYQVINVLKGVLNEN